MARLKTEGAARDYYMATAERTHTQIAPEESNPVDDSLIDRVSETLMAYKQKDFCLTEDSPMKVQPAEATMGNNVEVEGLDRVRSESFLKV